MKPSNNDRAAVIFNGTYTVKNRETGDYRTLSVSTVQNGDLAGKRILSLLTGPDNERDFKGFAFVREDGGVPRIDVWNRHRALTSAGTSTRGTITGREWDDEWNDLQKVGAMFVDLAVRGEGGHFWGGYDLLVEGRCLKCNRKLTTPESIRRGIGPKCAGRSG